MVFCRILGFFSCLLALVLLLLVTMNHYAASHGGHNLQGLLFPAVIVLAAGVCLLVAGWPKSSS